MLRINIDLTPLSGDTSRTLSCMTIENIGGTYERGDYAVEVVSATKVGGVERRYKTFIRGWDRRKSATMLVARAFALLEDSFDWEFKFQTNNDRTG